MHSSQGSSSSNLINLVFYAAIFVIIIGAGWWRRRQANSIPVSAPLLISLYTQGLSLEKLSDGTLANMHYDIMITKPYDLKPQPQMHQYGEVLGTNSAAMDEAEGMIATGIARMEFAGKIIMTLTLPARSQVHIACFGIPEKNRPDYDQMAKGSGLVRVSLEGDFPDYFTLYCTKDRDIELREVLDPSAMAFLVDYCKREDWELFEDTLYFSQTNLNPDTDQASNQIDDKTMVGDAEDFVNKILPVLKRMQAVSGLKPPVDDPPAPVASDSNV